MKSICLICNTECTHPLAFSQTPAFMEGNSWMLLASCKKNTRRSIFQVLCLVLTLSSILKIVGRMSMNLVVAGRTWLKLSLSKKYCKISKKVCVILSYYLVTCEIPYFLFLATLCCSGVTIVLYIYVLTIYFCILAGL